MPPIHLGLHFALGLIAVLIGVRIADKRKVSYAVVFFSALIMGGGLYIERSRVVSWSLLQLGWPWLLYWTNLTLAWALLLGTILIKQAQKVSDRRRAWVLSTLLVGIAMWSYSWYFLPPPLQLTGKVDEKGLCRQTSDDSCSAAAAVTLLNQYGIHSDEAEMAHRCLTRAGLGTTQFGLYSGLLEKTSGTQFTVRAIRSKPSDMPPAPSIISVGLKSGLPPELEERLIGYGWSPGVHHAVAILETDPAARKMLVADPSYGVERWPIDDLDAIWDGISIIITKEDR